MAATRRDALIDMIPQLIDRIERLEGAKYKKQVDSDVFGWLILSTAVPSVAFGSGGFSDKHGRYVTVFNTKEDAETVIRLMHLEAEPAMVYRDTLKDAF